MHTEGLLLCSQQLATGPCRSAIFNVHFNNIFQSVPS
jgi:hypothetical protein